MEYGAEEISAVDAVLVPGLLQTEEYARAIITADTAFIRQIEVQQRVEARMRRQERLSDAEPLRLNVVVSEAVLRQQTGGPGVLRRQLLHIVDMINRYPATIDFRVLPFSSRTGAIGGCSTIHILDFARPQLPTVGWAEVPGYGELVEDTGRIRDMSSVFGHLQRESLSPEGSLGLLEKLAAELDSAGE
ncbi:DUF5753 domain-containing protein [Nocardia cyriacigeorgica]|nr:DUF5753 domain-containing protein [Nocardia cyriacigeorgica]